MQVYRPGVPISPASVVSRQNRRRSRLHGLPIFPGPVSLGHGAAKYPLKQFANSAFIARKVIAYLEHAIKRPLSDSKKSSGSPIYRESLATIPNGNRLPGRHVTYEGLAPSQDFVVRIRREYENTTRAQSINRLVGYVSGFIWMHDKQKGCNYMTGAE